jgi:hypothetical protein
VTAAVRTTRGQALRGAGLGLAALALGGRVPAYAGRLGGARIVVVGAGVSA